MKKERKKIILYLYNSIYDPVIKGNIMLYITEIAKSQEYEFHIITYEQKQFELSDKEKNEIKESFAEIGIYWYHFKFTFGNVIFKGFDFLKSFFLIFYLRSFKGCKSIISLGSIVGGIAFVVAKILRLKLYLYQYEPHSEYALDGNMWTKQSMGYTIVHKLEYLSARYAKVISTGTHHMIDRLDQWRIRAKVYKIPSVVNEDRFNFNTKERNAKRNTLNLSAKTHLIIYPGKFGDLYYTEEIGVLFKYIFDHIDNCFFVVLTLTDEQLASKTLREAGLPEESYLITSATYEEMPSYLYAADLGVVAVPPLPSKKFCSNIKVGEYLCSGLPYIICRGISEDDEFAENNNVGVVLEDFSISSVEKKIGEISEYLIEDRQLMAKKCRALGMEYRGFAKLKKEFQKAVQSLTD